MLTRCVQFDNLSCGGKVNAPVACPLLLLVQCLQEIVRSMAAWFADL